MVTTIDRFHCISKLILHRKVSLCCISLLMTGVYVCVCVLSPDHVEDIRPWFGPATYKAVSIGMIIVLLIGVMVFIGGLAFVKNQKKSQKRFF